MVVPDDSFKKAGAVPFQWEIEPGVPKLSEQQQQQPVRPERQQLAAASYDRPDGSLPRYRTPSKRKPPPFDSYFTPPPDHDLPSVSFRSTRSGYERLDPPPVRELESVSAGGCFRPALFRKNWFKKLAFKKPAGKAEAGKVIRCGSELGKSVRRLVSSGKSLLASYGSSSSPSPSSHKSSLPSMGGGRGAEE